LDSYINSSGHIRLGTIFMDLDALAGVVSYKHTGDTVMTVTAAVDRITLQHPLSEICDLELSGKVTFATGRSSMEVSLQVAKAPEDGKEVQESDILMTCAFTMVAFSFLIPTALLMKTRYHSTQQPKSPLQSPPSKPPPKKKKNSSPKAKQTTTSRNPSRPKRSGNKRLTTRSQI